MNLNEKPKLERKTYTVHEVSLILGTSRNSIYMWVRAGQIPSIQIGKRVLIPIWAVDNLVEGKKDDSN